MYAVMEWLNLLPATRDPRPAIHDPLWTREVPSRRTLRRPHPAHAFRKR